MKRWEERISQLEKERNELQKKLMEVPTVSSRTATFPLSMTLKASAFQENRVVTVPDHSRVIEPLTKANIALQTDLARAQEELEHLHQCRTVWQEGVLVRDTQDLLGCLTQLKHISRRIQRRSSKTSKP